MLQRVLSRVIAAVIIVGIYSGIKALINLFRKGKS